MTTDAQAFLDELVADSTNGVEEKHVNPVRKKLARPIVHVPATPVVDNRSNQRSLLYVLALSITVLVSVLL